MTIELDDLITYWKDALFAHRLFCPMPTLFFVEQTIKYLEELKGIKEG